MTTAPALPADFNDFIGNSSTVESLRTAIAGGHLPHSLILAGPSGAGKYTLALMLAMSIECERQPRDLWSDGQTLAGFCGHCANCTRIASAADLEAQVAAAVAARDELRETDKKDTRVLIQPHPDVLILPPDPPQLLIKLGQVRTLIQQAHYLPAEAPRRVFILTAASMMKEAANSLLKILEEPPDTVNILILAENPGELLPTIRSRCATVRLGALPVEEIESLLAYRRPDPEVSPKQRALIARLSQGAAGRALAFDLGAYTAARADALIFLQNAAASAGLLGSSSGPAQESRSLSFRGSSGPAQEPRSLSFRSSSGPAEEPQSLSFRGSGGPAEEPQSLSFRGSSGLQPAVKGHQKEGALAPGSSSNEPDHTALFKMTETYRAGADGQQKTSALLRALALLLEDLLLLDSGAPELLRNIDIRPELDRLAATLPFAWIERASHALDQVQSGLRRNLLRSLSLDAFAAQLATPVDA